jgi:hypothetical protein
VIFHIRLEKEKDGLENLKNLTTPDGSYNPQQKE